MGLVLTKLWSFFGKEEHKIVILGLDNAGKTTILYHFMMGETVHTSPTIGSNVESFKWKNINFVMWDIGGQSAYRTTWVTYYANTECVIFVIDSSDKERIKLTKKQLHSVLSCELFQNLPILIFANKQDIAHSFTSQELFSLLELYKTSQKGWKIQPCCALSSQGLYEGLEWIVKQLKK